MIFQEIESDLISTLTSEKRGYERAEEFSGADDEENNGEKELEDDLTADPETPEEESENY